MLFCIKHNMFSPQHKLAKYQPTVPNQFSKMHIVICIMSFELLIRYCWDRGNLRTLVRPVKTFFWQKSVCGYSPVACKATVVMTPCSVSSLIHMLNKYLVSACYIRSWHWLGCWSYRCELNKPKFSCFCGAYLLLEKSENNMITAQEKIKQRKRGRSVEGGLQF